MNRIFVILPMLFVFSSCMKEKVTLESLLNEMTDRAAITIQPENNYHLLQFSSYDRKSVSPDSAGWWANDDYTQFVREEQNDGRREFVLFDTDGPGAIVRWWMTFAGEGASKGTLRIYIDGNETPVLEGNVLEILSGNMLAPEPLASSVSPETNYERRGHNLYLPVPYALHCKITYECEAVKIVDNRRRPSIYYNICYRDYDKDTHVESFSKENLEKAKVFIDKTVSLLLNPGVTEVNKTDKEANLKEGESVSADLKERGKAISKLSMKIIAANIEQALRSTVLSVKFDGEETIWIPAGEFFGTGYQIFPSKTWNTSVDSTGLMESCWLMPFKDSAKITVLNLGNQQVDVNISVSTCNYKWKKTSMHFCASWHEYNRISTALEGKNGNHDWHFDVNYADIKGQGVYVGDALTIFNTVDAWWGEGDEKIFVDNEQFPSSIGTGTEDYYGYAWCRPEKFTHPFIAQPTGSGNFHPGMSVNRRYRSLDAIPFSFGISSNIEMWHWIKTKMNYSLSAYWYAKPGYEVNIGHDVENAKKPVALKRSDIYKPEIDSTGKLEGECLEVIKKSSGDISNQPGNFGWSGDTQLWWRNADNGAELITKFIAKETGKYKFTAQLTKAVDYGIISISLNGKLLLSRLNCFNADGVTTFKTSPVIADLLSGENILTIKILGADAKAEPGNMAGIDFLQFEKIN